MFFLALVISTKEEAAIQTFNKIMAVLGEEYADMEDKEMRLGQDLSFLDEDSEKAKNMKGAAEIEKGEAEDFLAELLDMCSEKANQYDKRVQLRAAEQTAISQAIAILNNDMAFEAFGKVGATTKGFFFLQLRSPHVLSSERMLVLCPGGFPSPPRPPPGSRACARRSC